MRLRLICARQLSGHMCLLLYFSLTIRLWHLFAPYSARRAKCVVRRNRRCVSISCCSLRLLTARSGEPSKSCPQRTQLLLSTCQRPYSFVASTRQFLLFSGGSARTPLRARSIVNVDSRKEAQRRRIYTRSLLHHHEIARPLLPTLAHGGRPSPVPLLEASPQHLTGLGICGLCRTF